MLRRPRRRGAGIVGWRSLVPIGGVGGMLALVTLLAFVIGRAWEGTDLGTDMVLATLVGGHVLVAFSFRSEETMAVRLARNTWLLAAAASSLILLVLIFAVPFLRDIFDVDLLGLREVGVVVGLSLLPFATSEAMKGSGLITALRLAPD